MDAVHEADARARESALAWLPTSAIIPAIDAVALLGAAALARALDAFGLTFALLAWLLLNAGSWRFTRINPRVGGDVGWILARIAILSLALLAVFEDHPYEAEVLLTGVVAALAVVTGRALSYTLLRAVRARSKNPEPTLIVGSGPTAELIATTCRQHPEFGLLPVGLLDASGSPDLPLPLLGSPEDLPTVVRDLDVRRVIVAFGRAREIDLIDVLRAAEELPVAVYCVPRFFELRLPRERARTDDIWGIPLTRLTSAGPRVLERRLKRGLDVLVATVGLLAASPVLALAAIAVRASSPGPILFRQTRVGRGGRVFALLKFRSMRMNEDSDTAWSVAHDDRVTPVGRFLRRTSLDELPQLLNILNGDMSLVGPRPERPHFVEVFSETVAGYRDRVRVPVGLTGWAQVHGLRGDTSIADRVRFDNAYIENWSMWLDMVILARTIREALMGGERRARRHEIRRVLEAPDAPESGVEGSGEIGDGNRLVDVRDERTSSTPFA
jgi:exopolysaccharide biosynthesis polyprenyl glycosylphosphotransferase